MKIIILSVLMLVSFTVDACGDSGVEYEIKFKDNVKPTSKKAGQVLLVLPLTHQWWKLNSVIYSKSGANIPVQKTSLPEYPNEGVFIFQGTLEFFNDSHVILDYYPISREMPDGSFRKVACTYKETIKWDFL